MPTFVLHQGHVLDKLPELRSESVHMVCMSPPYWNLRDYDTEQQVWGGDPGCSHVWQEAPASQRAHPHGATSILVAQSRSVVKAQSPAPPSGAYCGRCSAWRGEFGSEPTPQLFIAHLVEICREVRRVLRSDGTLWLNLGDSYSNDSKWGGRTGGKHASALHGSTGVGNGRRKGATGYGDKQLMMIPARAAIALQEDGWILRQDIIWHKPNPLPESVKDRCTKAHEYVFLLTKVATYFFDHVAIAEPAARPEGSGNKKPYEVANQREGVNANLGGSLHRIGPRETRNKRSVWTIQTQAYTEDHYAAFPEELPETCIAAGTSEKGCCATCGKPWERILERGLPDPSRPQSARALELFKEHNLTDAHLKAIRAVGVSDAGKNAVTQSGSGRNGADMQRLADEAKEALGGYYREFILSPVSTIGWKPSCKHSGEPIPCTVLDPFAGRGTTGVVANRMGRNFVGVDLKPEYVQMSRKNIGGVAPLFNEELTA